MAGEFGGRVGEAPPSPTEARVLEALRQLGAGKVYDLAEALAAGHHLVEGLLRDLRRRGLVTCAEEGTPPVLTWRLAEARRG